MSDDFEPVAGLRPEPYDLLEVADPQALVVGADPMRWQILMRLGRGPRTVGTLAEELGVPKTRLYHHVNLLEQHGLIEVEATRQVRGVREKRYRRTARSYTLHRSLVESGESLDVVVRALFDAVRVELVQALHEHAEDEHRATFGRRHLSLTPADRKQFLQRLKELIEEYSRDEVEGADEERYGLLWAAYPVHE